MKALITGASSGIGRDMARVLAKKGYNLVLVARDELKLNELAEELRKENDIETQVISMDLSIEQNCKDLHKSVKDVDILINNAGIDLSNLFHLKTADEFRKTLDVNVVGAYNCSKSVSAHMLKQDYGRIINISSTNGMNTYYPMCIDYDASKAALISLTHNLAFEFGPYIHVNCIAPGFIGTENELDGYDEEFLKEEQEKIMVKRYGKPEEVAYLVKFLISDEANFINNSIIRIDGGQIGSM